MILNYYDYRNKVLGCWMGKNIGGTLGAPFEWKRQKNNVTFYTQDLNGNPLPNDDLDIQLLWLIALEERGVDINSRLLGDYWMSYITPYWSEYGIAKINMRTGLMPPLSGSYNNPFKDSCGAYIRSEIWACIAPGFPQIAAKYAFQDAVIDHGNGEGLFAEVFCAALESAAFIEKDIFKLIKIGLSYIPEDCGIARAVNHVMDSFKKGMSWEETRNSLLEGYRGQLYSWSRISPEDRKKGFAEGKLGWDAPSNIGIVVIGLLYGKGDFGESLCIAVNCGEDTDCTAATIGSILGIINGMDSIPENWIRPIGTGIKTACLNIGELGNYGDQLPADIYVLTDRTIRIARQIVSYYNLPVKIDENMETDLTNVDEGSLYASNDFGLTYRYAEGIYFKFDFFDVFIDYSADPEIKSGTPKKLKLTVINRYKFPETINIHWYAPEGCRILPGENTRLFSNHSWYGGTKELEFDVVADKINESLIRLCIELTVEGKSTAMLMPVILVNGN